MSDNNLIENTILLCDNLISEYVHKYTQDVYNIVKRSLPSYESTPSEDKALKSSIHSQLIDIASSIDNSVKIKRMFELKHDCGFLFDQCFIKDINSVINNITSLEFAQNPNEKKRIASAIASTYNWENLPPKAILIKLEKLKNSTIEEYAKDIYKRIKSQIRKDNSINIFDLEHCSEEIVKQHLETYSQQKQLNRRQCRQLARKYPSANISFWLHEFDSKISEISTKKHGITYTPEEYRTTTASKIRSSIINEKVM